MPQENEDSELALAHKTGAVAIGKNEGERLERCLRALGRELDKIVYVDSGSTDGSVAFAQSLGVEVVELDPAKPFTAARARNAGFERLIERYPNLDYVHFFDGDCEVAPGWLETAFERIEADPGLAAVTGVHEELHAGSSVYNRLCGIEWRWTLPFGEVADYTGCALFRIQAFRQVGGFDCHLITREEAALAGALVGAGWRILRIDAHMDTHDADMTRFGHWWRRAWRGGYGDMLAVQTGPMCTSAPLRRGIVSSFVWGLALPIAGLGLVPYSKGISLLLFLAYPLQIVRIYLKQQARGMPRGDALLYAFHCVLAKLPQSLGACARLLAPAQRKRPG